MSRQRIFNHNRLGKYYWQTANIIDDLGLSVHAFRLYAHLVRISSIHNVDVSTRALAKNCGMSAGQISAAKKELADAKLIDITKKPSGRGMAYDEISILDIAARNIEHCQKVDTSSQDDTISSPHELISSYSELASSPHEHLINNQEQTITDAKDDRTAAPIITRIPRDADVANSVEMEVPSHLRNQPAPPRKPRKLATNLTIDTTDDERVKAYLRILRQDEITQTNAGLIVQRVSDLDLWIATLERWAYGDGSVSYRPTSFAAMFENYDRRVTAASAPKTTTDSTPATGGYFGAGGTLERAMKAVWGDSDGN